MPRRDRTKPTRRSHSRSTRTSQRNSLQGVERLESRRLLAADFDFELLSTGLGTPDKPVAPRPEIRIEPQMQAAADAGETLATAWDLGEPDDPLSLRGYVGWWDPRDVYRFSLSGEADIDLRLDQLAADIDLSLYDAYGRQLAASALTGSSPEELRGTLTAGTYYVNVEPWGWADSTYRLSLDAELTVPPPSESDDLLTPLPDVPDYGGADEWNLNVMAAPEAWNAGYTGAGVTVAIVDTGVDLDHPDLFDSLWFNEGEIPGNGIDDDGNGYVDDYHGWDFFSGDNIVEDNNGHGTHVAGTVVAGRNDFGATGVASDVRLMPVRVLGDGGSGSASGVAAGIRYAADNGADVINLSLGGGYSSEIAAAVQYAGQIGSLVVAASGNAGASEPLYPASHSASMSHVISVGAHDAGENRAWFSNGVGASGAIQVDAPGVSIFSTYAGNHYARTSGTSMAAPHIAGLAALALSASPESVSLSGAAMRELVVAGADRAIAGSDSIGGINAATTVAMAAAGVTVMDATSSTSMAISTGGVSSQSIAALGRSVPTPEPVVRQVEPSRTSDSEPERLRSRATNAPRPVLAEIASRRARHDAALSAAMDLDDGRVCSARDRVSDTLDASKWQQATDELLGDESVAWI